MPKVIHPQGRKRKYEIRIVLKAAGCARQAGLNLGQGGCLSWLVPISIAVDSWKDSK